MIWVVGGIEPSEKEAVEYTLGLPSVTEPTTYELKTVVEYQTLEDLEILEVITYLTVHPNKVILEKGKENKGVVKGKGYSHARMGRRYSRSSENKGHGKGKGKPDKPGKLDKPNKPEKTG